MEIRNDHNWKEDIPAFRGKTAAFYAGELSKDAYKGLFRTVRKLRAEGRKGKHAASAHDRRLCDKEKTGNLLQIPFEHII